MASRRAVIFRNLTGSIEATHLSRLAASPIWQAAYQCGNGLRASFVPR